MRSIAEFSLGSPGLDNYRYRKDERSSRLVASGGDDHASVRPSGHQAFSKPRLTPQRRATAEMFTSGSVLSARIRAFSSSDQFRRWRRPTFTGALRLTGMTAPFVYDGAINGNVFRAHVEQVLVPTL